MVVATFRDDAERWTTERDRDEMTATVLIDTSTEFGARAARRLDEDGIIWLTTVRPDGRPEPSAVWFYWDGETVLIYSQPNTLKLRNIAANPQVALSFNTDRRGENMVVLSGTAEVVGDAPLATAVPAMMEKYQEGLVHMSDPTGESFAKEYSVAVRVTPTKLRGF